MTKWLEFTSGNIIDRYKIEGMTEEQFFDYVLVEPFLGRFKDISEKEYESCKSHEITRNYAGGFVLEFYRFKHASKEDRNAYNQKIRTMRRRQSFINEYLNDSEL